MAVSSLFSASLLASVAISSLASAGFLIIFAAVNLANFRLAARTNSRGVISAIGAVACIAALAALVAHIADDRPKDLILLAGLLTLTYFGEATYHRRRSRRPLAEPSQPTG